MALSRTRTLTACALAVALIALSACISIPIGPVPFTLQTFMVGLVLLILPGFQSVAVVALYLLLGLAGLPIFAGLQAGPAALFGPAGGFLMSYLLSALLISVLRRALDLKSKPHPDNHLALQRPQRSLRPRVLDALLALLFLLISYLGGSLWYLFSAGVGLPAALLVCVLPFVIPDLAKLVVVVLIAPLLRQVLPV
ncbi:MAG: biotin transporter BioY [Coriobacteriales bacterium]|jgi:biotin transport system substrate-specific component|nr:biotin transporter BioY [Coriobacteriales bacterium]